MPSPTLLTCLAALIVAGGGPTATEQLHDLFSRYHDWRLDEFPELAMARGDYSDADRIADVSIEAIERRHQETARFLRLLLLVPYDELSAEDRLNYELFERRLRNAVDGHRFRTFLMPIGGRFGPHQEIPQMAERVRFRTAGDYENYLTRLEQTPRLVRWTIEKLKLGAEEGRTPARVTLDGIPGQFDAILGEDGGLEALAEPLESVPDAVTEQQWEDLRRRFREQTLPAVRGAVRRLADYVTDEYLPRCRTGIAAADLPDGQAYYAYQLRVMTTTEMTAAEIHELGLDEVARIRREMMDVIRRSDFLERRPSASGLSDEALFDAFVEYLRNDPRFYHDSAEALLSGYRDICKRVDPWLAKLFATLPRLPYGVREIPAFMAPDQTTAYYSRGDIRNAEPGWFYANTYALDQRPTYEMIPLALHEAVPGHHLQVALAQELEGLPEFRRGWGYSAFGEGWALYSERLGLEMGLYDDPYDDFGRLLYEIWRACRLVVDPGMHALGWSREQAIGYMLENTALSRLNIETEVDRYINWPGQACAYKIGEIRIRRLREMAEEKLDADFDLRAFHDVVLGAGSIPLPVLEKRVNRWVNSQIIETYD